VGRRDSRHHTEPLSTAFLGASVYGWRVGEAVEPQVKTDGVAGSNAYLNVTHSSKRWSLGYGGRGGEALGPVSTAF